jgi:DNA-binding MarR family transcriptional regulator
VNSGFDRGTMTTAPGGFSPLLQAPARLQIVALLAHAQDAEFQRLKDVTGCSDSVMSKHLSALAEAGLIRLRKAAQDGRSRTWASLTREGRATLDAHVVALRDILSGGAGAGVV